MTPVNTETPQEDIGFLLGYFAVMIVSVIFVLLIVFIGWIGGLFLNLGWWNGSNFLMIGFILNMIIFPIYISGALEGLAAARPGRFRWYAFIYGTISMSILIAFDQLPKNEPSFWAFAWAVAYGLYTVWLANRMSR